MELFGGLLGLDEGSLPVMRIVRNKGIPQCNGGSRPVIDSFYHLYSIKLYTNDTDMPILGPS